MASVEDTQARIDALEREVEALRAALAARDEPSFGTGLDEREALLNEAERIVHLGSWMWDAGTGAIRWSDELFRILGVDPQAPLTPEAFFEGIHPDDVERVRAVSARGVAGGVPEAVDFRIRRPDGSLRDVHMEAAVVRDGATPRFVGGVLDVTERLAMETHLRHAQKMDAIGTFAGGIAHDFNNYLQVILGNLDLLGFLDLGPRAAQMIAQIREAAGRSERLTRQLLTFSRRGASQIELVSLDELLDQSMPMFQTIVGDRIELHCTHTGDDARVRCDRSALEQVVLNLIVNARDAMPGGGRVTIERTTVGISGEGGALPRGTYAVLAVKDEGCGIPAEVLPRIFEPFFTTKGAGHGTGLGLATAHGIVTRSGGTIEVESSFGKGTTMRVMLPLDHETPASAVAPAQASNPAPARGRVLVVEDQPLVRTLVRRQLETAGYEVLEAEDGFAALRVLDQRSDIALVLSDVSMPRMTGAELARKLASERPGTPVILMAGFVDANITGITVPVLHKPFERDELLRLVGATIRARAARPRA